MSSPSQSLSDVHTQCSSSNSGETGEENAEDSENVDVESQVILRT